MRSSSASQCNASERGASEPQCHGYLLSPIDTLHVTSQVLAGGQERRSPAMKPSKLIKGRQFCYTKVGVLRCKRHAR